MVKTAQDITTQQRHPQTFKGSGFNADRTAWAAIRFFSMDESDVARGLRHLKAEAKHRFREYAKRFHPDMNGYHKHGTLCTGAGLRQSVRYYDILRKLAIVPLTVDNAMAVLGISKGYFTTAGIDIP